MTHPPQDIDGIGMRKLRFFDDASYSIDGIDVVEVLVSEDLKGKVGEKVKIKEERLEGSWKCSSCRNWNDPHSGVCACGKPIYPKQKPSEVIRDRAEELLYEIPGEGNKSILNLSATLTAVLEYLDQNS